MKRRVYLEEDLDLIRKYFPGAKAVALHTPFDLTVPLSEYPWKLRADTVSEESAAWYGDLLWNR